MRSYREKPPCCWKKLEGQLATLRQRCAPVSQFATLSARFDRHLFQTRATTLQACLDEAGDNLAALRHAVEQQQLPQVAWLAEHLAAQLEAIAREASAWSIARVGQCTTENCPLAA